MTINNWQSKWSETQLQTILLEQFNTFWQQDIGIERTQLQTLREAQLAPHVVIVSGLRRAGKSTLLAQLAHQLGDQQFYYINFEDERSLGFQADDANRLFEQLVALYGERKIFIIDERFHTQI